MTSDILIIGAGPAGLCLAIALASAGFASTVIDRDPPEHQLSPAFDHRTTALSLGSQRVLAALGIWPGLAPHAGAILDIRVADQSSKLYLHYDHRDVGDSPMGWVVENCPFRGALLARAQSLADLITIITPAVLNGLADEGPVIRASLEDGRDLRVRLVVGADGRGSRCRQLAGIPVRRHDYHQSALVCSLAHERPHQGIALEHFQPGGPFAVLPLAGDHRSGIVWADDPARIASLLALSHRSFVEELQRRIGGWLGDIVELGPRSSYPLSLQMAVRTIAPRLALVADAAHAVHPIAGQGFNMGMRDVAALAEMLIGALRLGMDPGATPLLRAYQTWRAPDNLTFALATHGLTRLFSNDVAPVRLARDLGLATVNRLPKLKRLFMRHAMGVTGLKTPRLIQGRAL